MRERLVRIRPPVREDRVGEVVVLVDHHVQRDALFAAVDEQCLQLPVDGRGRQDAAHGIVREQIGVDAQRTAQFDLAVGLEALLQRLQSVLEGGEVEAQDHVAGTVLRRRPTDVCAVEDAVPVFGHAAVVVVSQHRHPQALAEAARAEQERVALVFQAAQKARLVHVQPAPQPDAADIGLTVGNARIWRCHGSPFSVASPASCHLREAVALGGRPGPVLEDGARRPSARPYPLHLPSLRHVGRVLVTCFVRWPSTSVFATRARGAASSPSSPPWPSAGWRCRWPFSSSCRPS